MPQKKDKQKELKKKIDKLNTQNDELSAILRIARKNKEKHIESEDKQAAESLLSDI